MTSSSPRLAAADRLLLRQVFAWARANGWRHNWEDMGDGQRGHRWSTGQLGAVTLLVDGDAFLFCWANSIQVETVREAVDVLVALGILPARFFSAIRNGYCHDEWGIFEDRREHGLGIAYTETRYTRDHAIACAEEQRLTRPYPIEVKRRKVLHTDWERVPDA